MCSLAQRNHCIPCLVVERLGKRQVVSSQIERLLHVRESKTRARIIGLGVKCEDLVHNIISDGREEDAEVG